MKSLIAAILLIANFSLEDIILDIYNAVSEFGEVEYEQLQADLYAIHESPIDLNHTSDEELSQLYFLSPHQIDEILLYADKHPFVSLYELRLISSLADYEIRDLLPFVKVDPPSADESAYNSIKYARDVFTCARHELTMRVDARDIENFGGSDPMFVRTKYRFDYQRRVLFGAQLSRPAGGQAQDLQYGAFLQLRDIHPHLHNVVAGNFQASFGQGLVFAPVFHNGKSAYVQSAAYNRQGLRYYSSVDGAGLHGAGATARWYWSKATRLDVTALYSLKRANDSTWYHLFGANLTFRHNQLQVELNAAQNIWSDSIHPYNNAAYNHHYFRGSHQAVIGASARYNHGWFDAFAEIATAENYERFPENAGSQGIGTATNNPSLPLPTPTNAPHWGIGVIAGSRFYPTDGISLIALYRYYSPYFDNTLGYAFSETSRIGDENGAYLGIEITRWKGWKISSYGDVFRFSGQKYGIPYSPSIGYDVILDFTNTHLGSLSDARYAGWWVNGRIRARKKGDLSTYSSRAQFNWQSGGWSLRTIADANITTEKGFSGYGVSIAQDAGYAFANVPLSLRGRVQYFDARNWNNRIYMYEHDVLYAFSIPAVYGLGGRAYICLKWQILAPLALYLRVSETVYAPNWAAEHQRAMTRTDVHLLLRAKI